MIATNLPLYTRCVVRKFYKCSKQIPLSLMVHVNNCCYFAGHLLKFSYGEIYVHVPFCRSKCFLLRVLFVASLKLKEAYLGAIGGRLICVGDIYSSRKCILCTSWRYAFLLWSVGSWNESYEIGGKLFVRPCMERTIELNPEDLVPEKLQRNKGFRL